MTKIVLEQHGDTIQMTFPAETTRRLGLKPGREVTLTDLADGVQITGALTPERRQQLVREVLTEQAEALRLLANR